MNKKGMAAQFVIVIIILIVFGASYIILRQVTDTAFTKVEASNNTYVGTYQEDGVKKVRDFFNWIPLIALFVIILWIIAASLRKSPEYFGEV